jgi:hypothetical protein
VFGTERHCDLFSQKGICLICGRLTAPYLLSILVNPARNPVHHAKQAFLYLDKVSNNVSLSSSIFSYI